MLGTTIIAYAITSLFFTKSETSKLSKKTVVQFDLTADMSSGEVGPDSFEVKEEEKRAHHSRCGGEEVIL